MKIFTTFLIDRKLMIQAKKWDALKINGNR